MLCANSRQISSLAGDMNPGRAGALPTHLELTWANTFAEKFFRRTNQYRINKTTAIGKIDSSLQSLAGKTKFENYNRTTKIASCSFPFN